MSTAAEAKEKRPRKPRARHRDVILAALEERLSMIRMDDLNGEHVRRVKELIDELNRSLSLKTEDEDA